MLPDSDAIRSSSKRRQLTDQDYKEVLIPRLESIIHEYGKARLLLDMGDEFQGWEVAAALGRLPLWTCAPKRF